MRDKIDIEQLKTFGIYLIIPVLILTVWDLSSIIINNNFILPRIYDVVDVLLHPFEDILGSGTLVKNTLVSVYRVFLGFSIAVLLAYPLGIAMGRVKLIDNLFSKTVELFRPIPPIAWVPLALAWLKIGIASILFIIAIGAFFPVLVNTISGVKNVKRTWIESIRMVGASEKDIILRVVVPGSAPSVWTGMRVGFGIAWMCVVAAEMLPGTNTGIGYLIMYAYSWGQMQVIIAGMIIIGLIGICVDFLFRRVENTRFRWRELDR